MLTRMRARRVARRADNRARLVSRPGLAHCPTTSAGNAGPPIAPVSRRTFPFVVEPIEGEAFDSWLEAIATRHDVPFGEIVRRCEIPHSALLDSGLISQDAESCRRIAATTGVDAAAVRATTMDPQYRPTVGLDYGRLQGNFSGWERRPTSRFCPQCLASNGGRWQSCWRLNWSFACVHHQHLLADNCPECCGPQRHRPHPRRRMPLPGRCAQIRPTAARGSSSLCGADLSAADTPDLRHAAAVLRAQQQITDLLAGRLVPLGVYGASPQPHPRQILNDIKILARWVLSRKECHALYRHAPSPIVDLVAGESADSLHRQIRLQPSALQAGVAITAAMDLLASPNISALASNFGPLMQTEHESGASIAIAGRQTLTFPVRSAHDRALAIAIAGQRPPAIKHMRAPAR
ncbi:TniQ family protein [Mycobacterium avium]